MGEDLVQRLLLTVEADYCRLPSSAADGVQLVDEDDRGRILARLLEEVSHPRGAHPNNHLHELRATSREEWHARLSGNRPRKQRLSRAWRTYQQDALGSRTAQTGVLLGCLEEIDDLDQLVLGFIDAGHIVEGDFCILLLVVATGFTLANAHERAPHSSTLLCRAPEQPDVQGDNEYRWAETDQERRPRTAA